MYEFLRMCFLDIYYVHEIRESADRVFYNGILVTLWVDHHLLRMDDDVHFIIILHNRYLHLGWWWDYYRYIQLDGEEILDTFIYDGKDSEMSLYEIWTHTPFEVS